MCNNIKRINTTTPHTQNTMTNKTQPQHKNYNTQPQHTTAAHNHKTLPQHTITNTTTKTQPQNTTTSKQLQTHSHKYTTKSTHPQLVYFERSPP